MSKSPRLSTTEIATQLMEPIAQELGLTLWDVRFEKEGNQWYLRYFLDREEGLMLADCEAASKGVSKKLDESDPIAQSYILEVGSPGIDRFLKKDEHFQAFLGDQVLVRLIRPVENRRNFIGTLLSKKGAEITILLQEEEVEMVFALKEAAYVRVHVDFEAGGLK